MCFTKSSVISWMNVLSFVTYTYIGLLRSMDVVLPPPLVPAHRLFRRVDRIFLWSSISDFSYLLLSPDTRMVKRCISIYCSLSNFLPMTTPDYEKNSLNNLEPVSVTVIWFLSKFFGCVLYIESLYVQVPIRSKSRILSSRVVNDTYLSGISRVFPN